MIKRLLQDELIQSIGRNAAVVLPSSGKTLWHLNLGGETLASPMTYELDHRQYVVMSVENTLYAFALPVKPMRVTH
jgi:hypothetical protein